MINNIPYGRQSISDEDIHAVVNALKSDFMTQGPTIAEFENAFAKYIGVKYAVAVSNGTAALHLAALALGVNENTRVITTPITFAASANSIKFCGGQIFFADIDPETFLLDIHAVKKLIEQHPKGYFSGIIPVDFAGKAVDLEAFRQLASEHGLWIVEDACHAPGGYFTDSKGNKQHCGNGNYADMAVFSFHPVKHIATGEGGMITTNNKNLYDKLVLLRTHGITKNEALFENDAHEVARGGWYYEMHDLGYNYRLTDLQAALGISQLSRAEKNIERRKKIAKKYNEAFAGLSGLTVPTYDEGHAWHLYVIRTAKREALYNYLKEHKIFAQVHYIPVHLMPYYRQTGYKKGDFPVSEAYYEKCLSIPMYHSLTNEEQQYIIDTIHKFSF